MKNISGKGLCRLRSSRFFTSLLLNGQYHLFIISFFVVKTFLLTKSQDKCQKGNLEENACTFKPMRNQNCREKYVLSCKININYISNYTNLSFPKEIANRMVFVPNVLSNQENCCWLPPFFILNDH